MSIYVVRLNDEIVGVFDNVYDAFHAKGNRVDKVVVNKEREITKLNPYQAKCLKEKFHEEAQRIMKEGNNGYTRTYSIEMLSVIHDMAKNDVWPDGNFSDMDCNVWSLFRR